MRGTCRIRPGIEIGVTEDVAIYLLNKKRREIAKLKQVTREIVVALEETHAKIAAMHPPPPLNSQLFTRLADYNTKATKAAQERAAAHLQRAAIVFVRALINGAGTDPTGVGTALAIYRQAISDHLPISTDLTA